MAPYMYMVNYSQPCRATLMAIKALNLNIENKEVIVLERQQLSPEYLKVCTYI